MTDFLQFVLSGIALGALYGLIALGLVVIFKATHVLNFAQGSVLLLGTYVVARLSSINFLLAVVAACVVMVLLALGIERLLVRNMAGRAALSITIMTVGLDVVLSTFARTEIGTEVLPIGDPWGSAIVNIGPVVIPASRVAAIVVAVVLVSAFFLWFKRTAWGTAFRAATERREIAPLMGIRLSRLSAMTWGISAALAVVAGVFLSTFPSPGVSVDLGTIVLRAFPAAIIGGLDSAHGAIIGGVIVGVAEVLAQGYQGNIAFLGAGFYEVLTYIIMILVLLFKPAGLFGTVAVNRA
jgi:branched-chain amino acid transport system permease protein